MFCLVLTQRRWDLIASLVDPIKDFFKVKLRYNAFINAINMLEVNKNHIRLSIILTC